MKVNASEQLIADFYSAAAGVIAWAQPLDRLVVMLDLCTVHIMGVEKRTGLATFSAESAQSRPLVFLEYLRRYQASDPRIGLILATSSGQWMHCHEHHSDSFVANNKFYQDFLIPNDGRYLSACKLVDNDETVFIVGLMRGKRARPLDNTYDAILSLVHFHLSQAMHIFLHARKSYADKAMKRQLLGRFNQPMLLLDEDQRVLHSNQAATDLLSRKNLLSEKNGFLVCTDKVSNENLIAAVRAVLSVRRGQAHTGLSSNDPAANARLRRAIKVTGSAGRSLLVFVSALWPSQSLNLLDDCPQALVVLHNPPLQASQLDPLILAECYELTPAEARVAVDIASGATAKEIAQRKHLALPTVRTHISRIMEKTGVTRQADLLRLLFSLPLQQADKMGEDTGKPNGVYALAPVAGCLPISRLKGTTDNDMLSAPNVRVFDDKQPFSLSRPEDLTL